MRRNSGFFRTELIGLGVLVIGLGAGCGEGGEAPEELTSTSSSALTSPFGECEAILASNLEQACVCTGNYYTGCTGLNPNRRFYTNLSNLDGSGRFNDSIHSFIVNAHVRMKACQDDTYRGICDAVDGPVAIDNILVAQFEGRWKLNDHQITSIYVGRPDECANPGSFQVALFKDDDYDDPHKCTVISAPWSSGALFPNASYNADVNGYNGGFGQPHDTLSSLIIGSGVRVELYKESNYGGGTPLRLAPGTRVPRLAAYGFNDIISSIKLNP
jgi:hypothetical protein